MWRWLRFLPFRVEPGTPPLRAVVAPLGDPYREDPSAPVMERSAEPSSIAKVFRALDEAGLAFRPRWRGFEIVGAARSRVMRVRLRDPARIVPSNMACSGQAPELLIDLALALVPLFGPLVADIRFAGTIFVDGSRDRAVLGEEAAQRIHRVGLRLATRAPISFPILLDLARRMRQPR
jgi:hypothetical protein